MNGSFKPFAIDDSDGNHDYIKSNIFCYINMLIKYRCRVVYSSRNIRYRNTIGAVIGRPTIHMRSSFSFKRSIPKWRPTIRVHRTKQVADVPIVNSVMTWTRTNPVSWNSTFGKLCAWFEISYETGIVVFQFCLFCLLWMIGFIGQYIWFIPSRTRYVYLSSAKLRLAAFQPALSNVCSDLTSRSCSLLMDIDAFFFWLKLFQLYFVSIMICMIYAWHRTIRGSHCIFAFSIVGTFIFHTDFVHRFDRIVPLGPLACFVSMKIFFLFECLIPHQSPDPLLTLCETMASSIDSNEILHGRSKYARFYRWTTRMKQEWGIQEEKLIFTSIVAMVANSVILWRVFV